LLKRIIFNTPVVPTPVLFPDRNGLQCMCYEQMMKILKDQACIKQPKLYRIRAQKPAKPTLET